VIASAGYTIYSGDALTLDVAGNIKLGTADASKGLGTGQNDYYAQADGYYLLGQTTLFGTAGYRYYGSLAGVSLSSAPYGTVGASQKLGDDTSAGFDAGRGEKPRHLQRRPARRNGLYLAKNLHRPQGAGESVERFRQRQPGFRRRGDVHRHFLIPFLNQK